tara:strand:+ start:4785 stop:5468 length:684 start_codon:yes stop_codon:yes gene_type:complete
MKLFVNKSSNFKTISDALMNASNNDEIYVSTGHYKEKLIINKEIKIIGVGTVLIYYDCDIMDHVISIKEKCVLENLKIQSHHSNIIYIYNCMDVSINNCRLISQTQNCINIFDSGFFSITNCIIEAYKVGINYNNIFNVFNHSGTVKNCHIFSHENSIKLVNNSKITILNSVLKSLLKCIILFENTFLTIKECTIHTPNENYILFKKNTNPKYNLISEDISFILLQK